MYKSNKVVHAINMSMLMAEVVITRKGQITIPAKIRKKLKLVEGSRVSIRLEGNRIIIEPVISIFDLAGSGSKEANPEELKEMLDRMRSEDE